MTTATMATMATIEKIKNYMRLCLDLGEHQYAGEVDCTTLAEDAMDEFEGYHAIIDTDDYFEWAFEVAEEWENGTDD